MKKKLFTAFLLLALIGLPAWIFDTVIRQGTTVITGSLTVTGTVNGIQPCPTNGANFSVNVTAGLALLPASGGPLDCRNLTGTQSMAADVTIPAGAVVYLGNVNLSGPGRFIVAQGSNHASIIGIPGFAYAPSATWQSGTYFTYTGADWAIKVGSSAGVTTRFYMSGVDVQTGASALGAMLAARTQFVHLFQVALAGPVSVNTQTGFDGDGTGGFSSDTILENCIITQFHIPVLMTGPISGNNANQFIGGTYQANGKTDTGSIALDIETGDSNLTVGPDLESADIGIQFGANATRNTLPAVRMEGSTINTHVKFLAGASFNKVQSILSIGTTTVISNAGGATNSVDLAGGWGSDGSANNNIFQLNNTNNSMFYKFAGGSTTDQIEGFRFLDHTQSAQGDFYQDGSFTMFLDTNNGTTHHIAARKGTSTDINAPAGTPVRFNVSSGSGVQFWNSAQTFHLDLNPTLTANRTWTAQDASGTIPLIIASGTSTFTTTAVGAGACQTTVTTAATNTLTSDTITTSYASAPGAATDSLLIVNAWPTAGNVNFSRCNPTAGSITPTALVINWRVIR